ncbi:MAG: hypothetical protein ABI281_11825 [Caldimonas sp.]
MVDAALRTLHVASDAPRTLRHGWKSVLLVCKACEKRGKGPKKITARQVAKELGRACRDAAVPRSRVMLTTCMGACPKKAFTVAASAPSGQITLIAFKRGDDAAAAVASLFPADPA